MKTLLEQLADAPPGDPSENDKEIEAIALRLEEQFIKDLKRDKDKLVCVCTECGGIIAWPSDDRRCKCEFWKKETP